MVPDAGVHALQEPGSPLCPANICAGEHEFLEGPLVYCDSQSWTGWDVYRTVMI